MTTPAPILALDLGTTSAKGFLVHANGDIAASQQRFYDTTFPQPGFAEQDPKIIFAAVTALLRELISHTPPTAVCFSAAMHSLLVVDAQGQPLTRAIIWSDTRSANQAQRLAAEERAPTWYERTGTPIHPMSPLCKLVWLKENQRAVFDAGFKFISIKEYILFQLTGEWVIDYSIASATGLFDVAALDWYKPALEMLGLSREKFSQPVPGTTMLKARAGILENAMEQIPLIAGASDGCLAQLGSDAMGPHDVTITLGTSGAVRVASHQPLIDLQQRIFNYLLDSDTRICGGATNCGTALVDWYTKNMDPTAAGNLNDFINEVRDVSPGCDGLIMLPHLLGERAPVYLPEGRGAFVGIHMQHSKKHFQRAVLEGIFFQLRWILERVEQVAGTRKNIFVSGGLTRATSGMQMLADVLGKPLIVQHEADASAMGAAKMGFDALGIPWSFSARPANVIEPNHEVKSMYDVAYRRFRTLFTALNQIDYNPPAV